VGDRFPQDIRFDTNGNLVNPNEAASGSKTKRKRTPSRRSSRNRTWLGMLVVIGVCSWAIVSLASSLHSETSHGFGFVAVGESRAVLISQVGAPCNVKRATSADARVAERGAIYYLWPDNHLWQLVVIGAPAPGRRGIVVIDRFTAKRVQGGANYCAGYSRDPFSGYPWNLAQ
jgi:hypothetical protein